MTANVWCECGVSVCGECMALVRMCVVMVMNAAVSHACDGACACARTGSVPHVLFAAVHH